MFTKKKKSVKRRALTPINRATLELIRPLQTDLREREKYVHTHGRTNMRAAYMPLYLYTFTWNSFVVVIAVSIRSYTAAVSAFTCRRRDSKVTSRWRVCTDAHRHMHTGVREPVWRGGYRKVQKLFFFCRGTRHISSLGRRFSLPFKGGRDYRHIVLYQRSNNEILTMLLQYNNWSLDLSS